MLWHGFQDQNPQNTWASVSIMSSPEVFLGCYIALLASMCTLWSRQPPPPPPHARETLLLLRMEDMKAIQCVSSSPTLPHLCRNVPLGCFLLWEGPCQKPGGATTGTKSGNWVHARRHRGLHGISGWRKCTEHLSYSTVLKKKISLWGDEQRLNEDCF